MFCVTIINYGVSIFHSSRINKWDVKMTHWSGLLGFRNTQQFSGIKRLLQDPLVADTDWDHVNVKHLPFEEWIHDYIQKSCKRIEGWGWLKKKTFLNKMHHISESKWHNDRKVGKYTLIFWLCCLVVTLRFNYYTIFSLFLVTYTVYASLFKPY